jgi:hypothetical protein
LENVVVEIEEKVNC